MESNSTVCLGSDNVANESVYSLYSTIYVNLVVAAFFLILFECVRHKKDVYSCRTRHIHHRMPAELPSGIFAWVIPILRIKSSDI